MTAMAYISSLNPAPTLNSPPLVVLNKKLLSEKQSRESPESVQGHSSKDIERSAKRKRITQSEEHTGHRPPGFWDNLSKVHLTRGALGEFDRRAAQSEQQSSLVPAGSGASTKARILQLESLARHGGPDLTHIRGSAFCHDQGGIMSQLTLSQKRPSASGLSASGPSDLIRKSRSTYDSNFRQSMIDGGIYPHDRGSKPTNIDEIKQCLSERRASLSPSQFSDTDFEKFTDLNDRASSETRVMADVFMTIEGEGRHKYHSGGPDHPFNHLEPATEYLPDAKPDIYDGALPAQIDRRVRQDLGRHIVPCNDSSRPAVPNFFVEGKSAKGRSDVAKLQACYIGAIGARAMHSLQNYEVPEPQYDGTMKSYSTIYHPGNGSLQLFGHHVSPPQYLRIQPDYHMTQLRSFSMTDKPERFREGATAFRNLRDLAKRHRDELIDQANRTARHAPTKSPSTALTGSRASLPVLYEDGSDTSADTSVDELAGGVTTIKRMRHMPSAQSKQ